MSVRIETVEAHGKSFALAEIELPAHGNFVVLSSAQPEKHCSHSVHVISGEKVGAEIKLGRGHEADIRIGDVSVSRVHAVLSCGEKGFTLRDNDSRFGTLVRLEGRQEVGMGRQLSVQASNVVLTFAAKSGKLI